MLATLLRLPVLCGGNWLPARLWPLPRPGTGGGGWPGALRSWISRKTFRRTRERGWRDDGEKGWTE